jgi:hypothetical protein
MIYLRIKKTVERLPHSIIVEFGCDTHYSMAKYFSQALNELVPEQELKKH